MNIWLCPIKPKNWHIIKKIKLFGFPKRASKVVSQVRPDDLIIFHVLKPVNGIIAICRVASEVYENHSDIWGKNRYPFRVTIEFIPGLTRSENRPIPLASILGKIDSEKGISIEPYLRNIWLTRLSDKQYKRLKNLFVNKNTRAIPS